MGQRRFFKRRDLLLVVVILLAAAVIWGVLQLRSQGKAGPYVEVIYRGSVVATVYLDEPGEFSVPQLPQVGFEIRDGAASFVRSNCPDQICVHTGWLSRPGHIAACLPNEVLLAVDAEDDSGPDAVAR